MKWYEPAGGGQRDGEATHRFPSGANMIPLILRFSSCRRALRPCSSNRQGDQQCYFGGWTQPPRTKGEIVHNHRLKPDDDNHGSPSEPSVQTLIANVLMELLFHVPPNVRHEGFDIWYSARSIHNRSFCEVMSVGKIDFDSPRLTQRDHTYIFPKAAPTGRSSLRLNAHQRIYFAIRPGRAAERCVPLKTQTQTVLPRCNPTYI